MESYKLQVDEPQRAGEVLAAAFREYGRRPVTYVTIGAVEALASLVTRDGAGIHSFAGHAILMIAFLACFTVTVCVASGWSFVESRARTRNAIVALAGLAFVVGLPHTYLPRYDGLFILISPFWLAVTAFAIPIVLHEQRPGRPVRIPGMFTALRRSMMLSQVAFLHAVLVIAILLAVTFLLTTVLVGALNNFGDQGQLAALVISRAVLVPVVFIGLFALYLDQRQRQRVSGDVTVGERA
jgi:hypothetical protein